MKRIIICCVLSAIFGGAVAAWLVENGLGWPGAQQAQAQDLFEPAPPALEFFSDKPSEIVTAAEPAAAGRGPQVVAASTTPLSPDLTSEERTNIRVYESANRGVVNILTKVVNHDRFFVFSVPAEGAGSGSVIDKRGHILTNNHVIEDAETIQVTLPSGKVYQAEVVGADKAQDVAVLKIDAPEDELFPIPIGTSDNLRVGQRVYTLGNPLGLEGTLTTGIISNLNRTLPSRVDGQEMKSIIQTDAAMNPGNSGGPLLDTSGRLIGMNVAIATMTGQSAGLGFAIPVNRVRQIVPELVKYGKFVRADIGIVAVVETEQGLQIVQANRGGPAEKAGLRGWKIVQRRVTRGPLVYNVQQKDRSAADVITAIDEQPVDSARAFVEKIEERRPGDQVVLSILREGKPLKVTITLGGV
jgi:S1-C subfamily serine protease